MPPTRLAVPVKYFVHGVAVQAHALEQLRARSSLRRWMPILDMILDRPLPTALT